MEKVQVSDSELVTLYVRGNEKAFEKLVQRHKSRIYTTIYLIVKDQYVAEDLLQDTFIKAVDTIKGGRYNDEASFCHGLYELHTTSPLIISDAINATPM